MKKIQILLICVILISVIFIAGCTSTNTYKDDPFVGTWVWHNSDDLYMIIEVNSDGTSTTSALIAGEYYLHEDPWNHISNNTYGVGITNPFYVTIASNGTTLISEDTPNIVFVKDDDYVIPTPPPTIINPTPTPTATPIHTATATPKPTVKPTADQNPTISNVGNEQAVKKAKSYLSFTSFSYQGLVEQLEYEGFTHAQAVYGANNCNADWFEQAVKKAKSYLSFTSFSYQGLVEQLEYEGFTHAQAVHGADKSYI